MGEFGKLNFSVSFNRTSAFPIEANGYFKSLEEAKEAAQTAVEVGSAESTYYIGETLTVVEENIAKTYIIQPDKTLKEFNLFDLNNDDLSIIENKLQLADRKYSLNNMGFKILRNISDNILNQEMINESNTIYEIRYNFDLNGNTINIPENCILLFLGGSLNNGTLNLNKTKLLNFSGDVILNGNSFNYGTFNNKPTENILIGFSYYCTDKKTPESDELGLMIYYKGNNIWTDSIGRIVDDNYPLLIKGTTQQRPTLNSKNVGFEFYDTTLDKKIIWNGSEWTDFEGISLNVLRIGKFSQKPSGLNINIGFKYLANDIRNSECLKSVIPIFYTGENWINNDGKEINSLTSLAKNTILFAGITGKKGLQISIQNVVTPNEVYYSTVDKKFVVLYNGQYCNNWGNAFEWNNDETFKPYENLYYVSLNENKRYRYFNNISGESFIEEEITLGIDTIPFNGCLLFTKIEEIGITNIATSKDIYWDIQNKRFVFKYLNKYYISFGNDYIWNEILRPYTDKKYISNNIYYKYDGDKLIIENK